MELFNKITVAHFIWYLVPGLALVFHVLFPFAILDPHLTSQIMKNLGSVGLILFGIFLGFVLDGLRLYRFRPGYNTIKSNFFYELHNIIGTGNLHSYFILSRISDVIKEKKSNAISVHHAIWIMHGHLAMLSFMQGILWIIISVCSYIYCDYHCVVMTKSVSKHIGICIYTVFSLIFIIIGYRFHIISTEDQNTTNNMFIDFTKQHINDIKALMNL
jgi:hypothetical protein